MKTRSLLSLGFSGLVGCELFWSTRAAPPEEATSSSADPLTERGWGRSVSYLWNIS